MYNVYNEVIQFIKCFQNDNTIKTFTEGCCYWFAHILKYRFWGTIMYEPVLNHFATLIDGHLFDITGELNDKNDWQEWDEFKKIDELETKRIYKYCIYKLCS